MLIAVTETERDLERVECDLHVETTYSSYQWIVFQLLFFAITKLDLIFLVCSLDNVAI